MPFAYYDKLTLAQRRIYNESNLIGLVELNRASLLTNSVQALNTALATGERAATEKASQSLMNKLTIALGVPLICVGVREQRPSTTTSELHGSYEVEGNQYRVSLWMRTARRKQVVKFKTFLRTLLHEFCHHLDYHHFRLRDSFHTEGFYKRESSLMQQLYPSTSIGAMENTPRKSPNNPRRL